MHATLPPLYTHSHYIKDSFLHLKTHLFLMAQNHSLSSLFADVMPPAVVAAANPPNLTVVTLHTHAFTPPALAVAVVAPHVLAVTVVAPPPALTPHAC